MLDTYDNKDDYIRKLQELIDMEAEIDRLNTEVIAESGVSFVFEEVLEIYCRLKLRVPKTNQQYLREQAILSVVIPIAPIDTPEGRICPEYIGTGIIKKVILKTGDPLLTIIF